MKVLIVGAGLIGVTTAYLLRQRGYEVTVLERREAPARETSFANGGFLCPSASEPWNSPGCWRPLLASLGRSDAAMQLRVATLPKLVGWGTAFLWNSRAEAFRRNAQSNQRLALYSLEAMQSLRDETGISYARSARGFLRIFRNERALREAMESSERLGSAATSSRLLTSAQTVELEPALTPIKDRLIGAIHYPRDETGDAHRFCVALAERARQAGVEFRFQTEIASLEERSGRITAVVGRNDRFVADIYVIAAGSYSTPLLKTAGVSIPVQPVKGYSITCDVPPNQSSLRTAVLDDDWHVVLTPLEGVLRVAGTAEFAGYDLTLREARLRNLFTFVGELLPQLQIESANVRTWCGLRPVSVDGVPIIGFTAVKNLLVNTGHGPLGWTMAAGSAHLLADLVAGKSPAIDPALYALARFARRPVHHAPEAQR
jgi:D-amino-acid dehydrogenase